MEQSVQKASFRSESQTILKERQSANDPPPYRPNASPYHQTSPRRYQPALAVRAGPKWGHTGEMGQHERHGSGWIYESIAAAKAGTVREAVGSGGYRETDYRMRDGHHRIAATSNSGGVCWKVA